MGDRRTIRTLTGRVHCHERVVEMVPYQRFSYEQASGLFTSHRGCVDHDLASHADSIVSRNS
ncbi:hypothetical protein ACFCY9_00495 [Streptomyces fimicarius]|uniref:hypothetical protein n=1 Tax=Streptomyces griseus TaxID=1911 RepID=UPI0035DD7F58